MTHDPIASRSPRGMPWWERALVGSILAAAVILTVGVGRATADLCTGTKLKAMGKKESGLLGCQSKVAAKNDANLDACERRVSSRFSAAFANAGACPGAIGACMIPANFCETTVASAMTDTFPSKCEAAKRKAAGKLAGAELGCYGEAATKGSALDATCIAKATGKFKAALTKVGACADGGSPQMLVEDSCVKPAVTTDGGGTVIGLCPGPCGISQAPVGDHPEA